MYIDLFKDDSVQTQTHKQTYKQAYIKCLNIQSQNFINCSPFECCGNRYEIINLTRMKS